MSLVKRAVLLLSGERYLVLTITLCQTALVSRLLTPEEVGLSLLGVALVQVIDGMRDFGTTNYIIHDPAASHQSARTAFTVLLALSAVFAVALVAFAGLWARVYGQPLLEPYLRVLGLSFLLVPFSGPLMALMRRDFQFAALMWVNVGTCLTYAVVLVTLALLGFGAMSFAWAAVFILMPLSGVYYPVTVLPHWLQVISYVLPPAYIFEGMRAILRDHTVQWHQLALAFGLSVLYLVIGFQVFLAFFRSSRRAGSLLGQGE